MANMTLDEALGIATLADNSDSIHINPETRQFIIPSSQMLFGVESDEKVEIKHIVIDGRYHDGTDLSKLIFRVNYRNANPDTSNNKNTYLVQNVTANENSIEFDWIVDRAVTAYKGTIAYIVCGYSMNSDGTTSQEWNTTLGLGTVLEGLEVGIYDIGGGGLVDELKSIQYEVLEAKSTAQVAADAASRYASATNTAASTATSARDAAQKSASSASTSAENASKAASSAVSNASAAKKSADEAAANAKAAGDAATKVINEGIADKLAQMQDIQDDVTAKQSATNTAASTATSARDAAQAAQKAASDSATASEASKDDAKTYADQAKASADIAAGYAGAATFSIGYDSSGMLTLFMDNS